METSVRDVERKFRPFAGVLLCLLWTPVVIYGVVRSLRIVFDLEDPIISTHASKDWGAFPNLWVCPLPWTNENVYPERIVIHDASSDLFKTVGEVNIEMQNRTYSFAHLNGTYGGKTCAVFLTSAIPDDITQPKLSMWINQPDSKIPKRNPAVSILAESSGVYWKFDYAGFESDGYEAEPKMSYIYGLSGRQGFPLVSIRLTKTLAVFDMLLFRNVEPKFTGQSMSSFADSVRPGQGLIMVAANRKSVLEETRLGKVPALLSVVSELGGFLSILALIWGSLIVVKIRHREKKTLYGNQEEEELPADSDDEKLISPREPDFE